MKPTAILTAALLCALSPVSFAKPIKVFILAGQSNMEGQGSVDHDDERDSNGGKGNLVWSMKNSKSAEKLKKLKNEKGEWVVRDDVRISPCPTHGHHWFANAESYFLIGEAAGEGMKRLLGVLAPVSSGESRPTLKFTGSAPATVVIEEAFKMSLDNLIDINSIPYDPGKWNDTGLLETATDSRFLRAAPAYGENPWVSGPKLRGGAEC